MTYVDIEDFYKINKDIGCPQSLVIGEMGVGKTNLLLVISERCHYEGESIIWRGKENCEWRHLMQVDEIRNLTKILIPSENYHFYEFDFTGRDMWEIDIRDKFPGVEVIADRDVIKHLDFSENYFYIICEEPYAKHPLESGVLTGFWLDIAKHLIKRKQRRVVTLIMDEVGSIVRQYSSDKLWHKIVEFCDVFTSFRKNFIRFVGASQMTEEINSRLWKKCQYFFVKKTVPHDSLIKKSHLLDGREFISLDREDVYLVKGFYSKKVVEEYPRVDFFLFFDSDAVELDGSKELPHMEKYWRGRFFKTFSHLYKNRQRYDLNVSQVARILGYKNKSAFYEKVKRYKKELNQPE